jgi:hypothetical protein
MAIIFLVLMVVGFKARWHPIPDIAVNINVPYDTRDADALLDV